MFTEYYLLKNRPHNKNRSGIFQRTLLSARGALMSVVAQSCRLSSSLAINGSPAVRTAPLPWEFPGALWIGDDERKLILQVVDARTPFRFYGIDPQQMVDTSIRT
jgi:hypothetical protein